MLLICFHDEHPFPSGGVWGAGGLVWETGGVIRDEQSTGFPHGRRYGEIHGLSTRSPANKNGEGAED